MRVGRFLKDNAFAKLRWEFSTVLNLGTTTHISGINMLLNGVPSIAAVNGASFTPAPLVSTPYGWATLKNLYNEGKVFGSKVVIRIMNTDSAGTAPTDVVWATLLPAASDQTLSALYEEDIVSTLPYTKKTLIHNKPLTSKSVWKLSNYISTRKIEGITKAEFEGSSYNFTTATGVPSKQASWFLLFNTFTQTNFTATDKYAIHVSFTMYTKFYKRNAVPLTQ